MEKTALAKPRMFAPQMISAVIFLVIQYVLGMYINLYVEIPSTGPARGVEFCLAQHPGCRPYHHRNPGAAVHHRFIGAGDPVEGPALDHAVCDRGDCPPAGGDRRGRIHNDP